jgi:hypothetical protein
MTEQSADIALLECTQCGFITMSVHRSKILDKAEHHRDTHPEHEIFLHVFESDTSRRL